MSDDARVNQTKQFNQIHTESEYDIQITLILVYANRIWFIQTVICMLFCMYTSRLKPIKRKNLKDESILILQFLGMLISNSIIYLIQLSVAKNWIEKLDTCLHHVFSIFIFIQTLREYNIISSIYLLPYLTHTIYWSNIIGYEDILLAFYYISFLITCLYLINKSILNEISYIIPLYGIIISTVNLFWYFHGQNLNIFNFQRSNVVTSLIKSILVNLPVFLNFHFILSTKET